MSYTISKKNPSSSEERTSLVNASDGAGLHFDGSGVVAFTPVDLGSAFSHEFVLSTSEDLTSGTSSYIIDYHRSSGSPVTTDRFIIGFNPSEDSGNLAIYDNTDWVSFGVNPLTDLKVHHLVVTVSGTSAVLYDNGNQVGTADISSSHGIDGTTNAGLAGYYNNSNNFEGTIYRARSYNKALEPDEVRTAYERADVDFSSQYGSQTKENASTIINGSGGSLQYDTFSGASNTGFTAAYTTSGTQLATTPDEISLTNGKRYRVKFTYTYTSGQRPRVRLSTSATGSDLYTVFDINGLPASTGAQSVEFDYTGSSQTAVLKFDNTSAASYAVSNLEVVQIGCVSDYQTQWANPTQSLTVQDASGNADGTASTSGVTQVQPIIQGNMRSLAVTTSQQAAGVPADGEVIATGVKAETYRSARSDGDVYIQAATASDFVAIGTEVSSTLLKVDGSGNVSVFGGATSDERNLRIGPTDVRYWELKANAYNSTTNTYDFTLDSPNYDGNIILKSNATERMRIDSSGNVTANGEATIEDFGSYRNLVLRRAQGTSASPTTIANTQTLGKLSFRGYTGSVYREGAAIAGKVSAHVGGDEIPSSLIFYTAADGATSPTVRLEIDNTGLASFNNGIAFSQTNTAATGAAATGTTLDHYEEGTWTPVVAGGTMVISTTSSGKQARYTRIGDLVFVQCFCDITFAGDSTALQIEGLPFSAGSGDYAFIGVNASGTTVTNPYARVQSGNDHIDFFKNAQTGMPQSEFGSGNLIFSGCYNVG